jgi:hypothetical protein
MALGCVGFASSGYLANQSLVRAVETGRIVREDNANAFQQVLDGYDIILRELVRETQAQIDASMDDDRASRLRDLKAQVEASSVRIPSMTLLEVLEFDLSDEIGSYWSKNGYSLSDLDFLLPFKVRGAQLVDKPKQALRDVLGPDIATRYLEREQDLKRLIVAMMSALIAAFGALSWFFFRQAFYDLAVRDGLDLARNEMPEGFLRTFTELIKARPKLASFPSSVGDAMGGKTE